MVIVIIAQPILVFNIFLIYDKTARSNKLKAYKKCYDSIIVFLQVSCYNSMVKDGQIIFDVLWERRVAYAAQ